MTVATTDSDSADHVERARFNMIEQQIRPWQVLDPTVLDLLSIVRREEFVSPTLRSLAFTDIELPLRIDGVDTGETMLAPKVEARFMQELQLRAFESVLEIGTGSGYMAALAAHRAAQVVSVEINPMLVQFARANLLRAGVRNVRVEALDGARGVTLPGQETPALYDAIIVSGALPVLPPTLTAQLKPGGRMVAIVGDAPAMQAQLITRIQGNVFDTVTLFETDTKPLINAWQPSRFRF